MRLETAVAGAIATAQESARASTVTEFVAQVGGTRAAAEQLGVTMRTVQRYLKGEAGGGGQARKPTAAVQAKLQEAAKEQATAATIAKMRAQGIVARFGGVVRVSNTSRERTIAGVSIPGEDLADMLDAYEGHKPREAAFAFNEAFADAYGVPGMELQDVDELVISIG